MEPKLSSSNRLDHMDVEQFRSMLESPAFGRFVERVRVEYSRACAVCVGDDHALAIRRAQGAAAALRVVMGLPEQMLAEMRNTAKRGRG